jgi:predicted DsbA family dithiol-disulfide isomerase
LARRRLPGQADARVEPGFCLARIGMKMRDVSADLQIQVGGDFRCSVQIDASCEGVAIGDPEILVGIATDAGLDAESVRSTLASDAFRQDVREDEALASHLGIRGVPFFVVDGRLGVSGAQDPPVLVRALERAALDARQAALTAG